jgi:hypothetical protein
MRAIVRGSAPRTTTHLVIVASVALAASLGLAAAASAQTGLQANISVVIQKPQPCPNAEFFCGTVATNYGPAAWTWTIDGATKISNACTAYESAVTFELSDGSRLALDENGTACEPGNAFSAPGAFKSDGNPFTINGTWTVQSAAGQFASITGGGTDTLSTAGARATGTYTQTS